MHLFMNVNIRIQFYSDCVQRDPDRNGKTGKSWICQQYHCVQNRLDRNQNEINYLSESIVPIIPHHFNKICLFCLLS